MHLQRDEISALFERELGSEKTNSPEELTMIARRFLRGQYIKADMGISGGNFIVADEGMISITENEGNARLTTALPRITFALVGIEKIVPKLADLALLLPDVSYCWHWDSISLAIIRCMGAAAAGRDRWAGRVSTWCCWTIHRTRCSPIRSNVTRCTASAAGAA
jgi:hypothetical protein